MKVIVYTAIFGSIRDSLRKLPDFAAREGWDVRFEAYVETDFYEKSILGRSIKESRDAQGHRLDATGWTIKLPVWHHKNPRLRARRHKLLSHQLYPDADCTIWLDGCLTPVDHPADLVEKYLDNQDICLFEHMQRACVYQEGQACKDLRKDLPQTIDKVLARYRREGYPTNNGLAETTCVMRRHTEDVKKFNEAWWEELRNNSVRDQLSFDYLIWKMGLDYMTFEGKRTDCAHFDWKPHR